MVSPSERLGSVGAASKAWTSAGVRWQRVVRWARLGGMASTRLVSGNVLGVGRVGAREQGVVGRQARVAGGASLALREPGRLAPGWPR